MCMYMCVCMYVYTCKCRDAGHTGNVEGALAQTAHVCVCICVYVYTRKYRHDGYTSDVAGALSQTAHVCVCICVDVCMYIHVNAGMLDTLVISPVPEGLAGYWPFDDPVSQVCLYVCVSVVICVSVCMCVCVSAPVYFVIEGEKARETCFVSQVCICVSVSLCLRVPVSLCLCVYVSVRLCAYVPGCLGISVCLHVSMRVGTS